MFLKSQMFACALAFCALAPAPASADEVVISVRSPVIATPHGAGERSLWERVGYRDHFSPQEVRRILRREGFRAIEFVDRDGRIYVARAENHRGRDVIVRVSARSGAILSVERIRRRGHGGWNGGHGGWDGGHGGWDGGQGDWDDRPRCWLPEGCR